MIDLQKLLTSEFGVSEIDFEKALAYQTRSNSRIEKLLVNMGAMSEELVPKFYATSLQLPLLTVSCLEQWQRPDWHEKISLGILLEQQWFPFKLKNNIWSIAVVDPLSIEARQQLDFYQIIYQIYVLDLDAFALIQEAYISKTEQGRTNELSSVEEERLKELASEAPTVNQLNSLIGKALKLGASDMHLEPFQGKYRVRFRIDGVLQDIEMLPAKMRLPVASRLKILSGMDIAEKRKPQDGKIEMKIASEEFDIRVSCLPLNEGESIVMRFLRKEAIKYEMDVLGLSTDIQDLIEEDLTTTAGVILLTGPTGSGKTTSLYTFLNALNNSDVKIVTLEDPVEYQLEGVNQVQVQSDIGFDFSAGLRSIVRQDPDVIMLGEIRDAETAKIAMQSALTGHLVFSTVHTNDAASAYTRLIDLGAEEFLLNAAITSIIAQRLARKLCKHCSVPVKNINELKEKYQLDTLIKRYNIQPNILQAVGCEHCNHTGYKGRIAIVEYLRCDDDVKKLAKDKDFPMLVREISVRKGYRNLLEDGLYKALRGITSIDEVIRVAG
jgi:general secretion pathway protein E